jgi:hypothetical protein
MRINDIRREEGNPLCYVIFEIADKEDMKMLDGLRIGDTITQMQTLREAKNKL